MKTTGLQNVFPVALLAFKSLYYLTSVTVCIYCSLNREPTFLPPAFSRVVPLPCHAASSVPVEIYSLSHQLNRPCHLPPPPLLLSLSLERCRSCEHHLLALERDMSSSPQVPAARRPGAAVARSLLPQGSHSSLLRKPTEHARSLSLLLPRGSPLAIRTVYVWPRSQDSAGHVTGTEEKVGGY